MMTPEGTTGDRIPFSVGTFMSIAAFTAVAWYNVAELNVQVFLTFKRHRGLYFWSLLISSYGCVLHALGFLLKFFQLTSNNYVSVTIITIGWYAMVTGQSIVLYSRLHLVVRDQRVLRAILTMIIVDAILFHIPTTVLTYGSNTNDPHRYTRAFNIMEKLQMTAFCVQEFIISGVYVWATVNLLRPVYHGRTRKVMTQLIWINCIIIGMDICLLAMEYSNIYDIEATLKAMVYSIKLKLEFAVLNQLMTLANSSVNRYQTCRLEKDHGGSGATIKHLEDENSVPGTLGRPLPGRSRSTEYISNNYRKPERSGRFGFRARFTRSRDDATSCHGSRTASVSPKFSHPSRQASSVANESEFGSVGGHDSRFRWVPSLDRKATPSFIDIRHIENAQNQELNIFTNPAACYRPGGRAPHGYPPHDGLGGIPDTPIVSPRASHVTPNSQQAQQAQQAYNQSSQRDDPAHTRSSSHRSRPIRKSHFRRTLPALPSSNANTSSESEHTGSRSRTHNREVLPSGLIRSTRPSVTDWAQRADSSDASTCSTHSESVKMKHEQQPHDSTFQHFTHHHRNHNHAPNLEFAHGSHAHAEEGPDRSDPYLDELYREASGDGRHNHSDDDDDDDDNNADDSNDAEKMGNADHNDYRAIAKDKRYDEGIIDQVDGYVPPLSARTSRAPRQSRYSSPYTAHRQSRSQARNAAQTASLQSRYAPQRTGMDFMTSALHVAEDGPGRLEYRS